MGLQHLVGGGEGCVKGVFSDIKFLSMSACLHVCMPVAMEGRRLCVRFPGTGVITGREPPCGCQKPNTGPL